MRRGGATALVVVVVAAIALAAGLDALRGGETVVVERTPEPLPSSTGAETLPEEEQPLVDRIGGRLYFTDESCELQAVELLDDAPVDAPNWDECRFVLSPDGRHVSGAGSGWDPSADPLVGRLFRSGNGTIQVSSDGGPEGEPFAGRAPAWRPDGTLTYFADGAVREWPSGDVVLSQEALVGAALRAPVPFPSPLQAVSVREAAWLDDGRLAAIMSTQINGARAKDLLAVYDGNRLGTWRLYEQGDISDLRVSPRGTFAAVKYGSDGFDMLDSSGESVDTLGIVGYRAIAWSPDDQWAAVAADGGVFIFRPGVPGPPEIELALDARDLDWRGELGPDAVADSLDTGEAAAWLARAGARGRLLVTRRDGGTCRLRALEIPGLEWAETPPAPESPCRFTIAEDGTVSAGGVPGIAATPTGRPTYVADGELFAGNPGGRSELLVSGAELEKIFGAPSALEEVAWVDEDRFWAVVRSEGADGIALLTTDALVYKPWFAAPQIEGLRVGQGGMVAASSDRGVAILGDDGRRRLILTNGRDVAWAPGEPIAAVSTRDGILFVAPLSGEEVTLPLEVSDLDWAAR